MTDIKKPALSPETLALWTEKARRDDWHLFFTGSDIRRMLAAAEEAATLRRERDEAVAGQAVLADFIREEESHWLDCEREKVGVCTCREKGDNADREHILANLPASVRRHLAEVEALREVARATKRQCEIYEAAAAIPAMNSTPDPQEYYEDVLKPALAALDAVRKEGADG